MNKKIFLTIIIFIFFFILSCSTIQYDSPEYQKIWNASYKVLKRHGLIVRKSLYREGTLVATSRVNGDFLNKARVKVIIRIEEGEEGYLEPVIRVLEQLDNSDAKVFAHPDYQAETQWINIGHKAEMEAQLYNEIQQELGNYNPYDGRAWKPLEKTPNSSIVGYKKVKKEQPLREIDY